MAAQPPEPPQDGRHMGPEHAAVVVGLVDHDVAQVAKKAGPACVSGQQRAVQHVGVAQHVASEVPGEPALVGGGVAVKGGDLEAGQPQIVGHPELVVCQRLGGGQVEGRVPRGQAQPAARAPGIGRHPADPAVRAGSGDRQQVRERLSRSRSGGDRHMLAGVGGVRGERLMPPQGRDAEASNGLGQLGADPRRERRGLARSHVPVEDRCGRLVVGEPAGHAHPARDACGMDPPGKRRGPFTGATRRPPLCHGPPTPQHRRLTGA